MALKGFGFDREIEARGEADGAEHAEFVFGEAQRGIADGADDFGVEIAASADEVEDLVGERIEQQAVDGEVAALDIFLWSFAEADLVRMAAIANIQCRSGRWRLRRRRDGIY